MVKRSTTVDGLQQPQQFFADGPSSQYVLVALEDGSEWKML